MNPLNTPLEAFSPPVIGVFDSGIGGLTAVRALKAGMPAHEILFLADTARSPYACRSMETVARFADAGIRHLIDSKVDVLVIGCSAAASAWIRGGIGPYPLPVVDRVTAGVDAALSTSKTRRFGVLGNRAALESGAYEYLIQKRCPGARVVPQASFLLDVLIEEGWAGRPETARIAKKLLHPLRMQQIDTVILDSPFLTVIEKKIAMKAGKNVTLIDSGAAMVRAVKDALVKTPEAGKIQKSSGGLTIRVTDRTPGMQAKCEKFLKSRVALQRVSLFPEAEDGCRGLRD